MMKHLQDVSLDLLRVFDRVARTGSMTAAARSLFLTQPAISHSIAQLEDELGCRLFLRANRRLILTDEGASVFATTNRLHEALAAGERSLQEARARRTGLLRIGCPYLILQTCLTPLLAAYHKAHPDVRIQIEIENRMRPMLELVHARKVDLLFLATPEAGVIDSALASETLGYFHYAFKASREHFPQLIGRTLTLEEINRHPIVILRAGNNTRDYLEQVFAQAGLKLNVQWETLTMGLTEEFTKAGFGIGAMLVSKNPIVKPHHEGLFTLKTAAALPNGRYLVFQRPHDLPSPAAVEFLSLVRERLSDPSRKKKK